MLLTTKAGVPQFGYGSGGALIGDTEIDRLSGWWLLRRHATLPRECH
jgi:hypothetical protein